MMQGGEIMGVVGGMGPLASAEFVSEVYRRHSFDATEQGAPFVILCSDPSIPDRSTSFLNGRENVVYERLLKVLDFLDRSGATRFVICCFTIHHLLPRLPDRYLEKTISLVDVTVERILASPGAYLFLSTTGTRKMKILEMHPGWPRIKDQVCFPTGSDQEWIHRIIYDYLKLGVDVTAVSDELQSLINNYDVKGVIAGCTELHLLSRHRDLPLLGAFQMIDPLAIIAHNFQYYLTKGSGRRSAPGRDIPAAG